MELAKEAAGWQRLITDFSRNSSTFCAAWSIPRACACLTTSVLKGLGSGKLFSMCFASKMRASPCSFRILYADEEETYSGAYSWAFAPVFCGTATLCWDGKTLQYFTHHLRNIWGKHFLKGRKTKPLSFLESCNSIPTFACRNNTRPPFH